ncbi:MAG TPA: protease complex subunit PrcB family protein [Flavobacterium sp.]|nr:protease complex subunit PrcB family protein [Flavobacterium sp.]
MKKLVTLFSVLILFSCSSSKSSKAVTYVALMDSSHNGKQRESYEVIDNHIDLSKTYAIIKDELVPNIDFAKARIVVLFMGQKNTGGYAIGIEEVREKANKVIVKIKKTYPDGMATMVITEPFFIAKINTTKKIEFEE